MSVKQHFDTQSAVSEPLLIYHPVAARSERNKGSGVEEHVRIEIEAPNLYFSSRRTRHIVSISTSAPVVRATMSL